MAEIIEKYKIPIGLSLIGIVLILGGLFTSNFKPKDLPAGRQGFPKESIVNNKQIKVDVSGAVKSPGVYQLDADARVEQAILAAGGVTDQANQEYLSKYLNMAQKVSDGIKIYIPAKDEQPSTVVAGASIQVNQKININTASLSELDSLSGIGPVTSSKIISGRPYQSIEELLDKKILSKTVFEKIKDQISVY